jgi:septal ring-binding cell division protein DamX
VIRILAPAAALALVALPVLAQPANMRPTRDVTVTYRMSGVAGTPPQDMSMAFAPATGKQRVDPPGGMGWMLIDRQANSAVMVMDAQRATLAMPPATVAAMTQEVPAGATFTRKGGATVAGTACIEWDMTAGGGHGTSCITDDGVLLRTVATAPNGGTVTMEATQVSYGPIDPARLSVPAGYTAMQMPAGAPGTPGAPTGR